MSDISLLSGPLLRDSSTSDQDEPLDVVYDRESLYLEMLNAGLNLAEKILSIKYCREGSSVTAIYAIHILSGILKLASSSINNATLKLLCKIILEAIQLVVFLALLGYSYNENNPVATAFFVIFCVQITCVSFTVPAETARKRKKKELMATHPGLFVLYNNWYDNDDLIDVKRDKLKAKLQRMLAPTIIPLMVFACFDDSAPIKSNMFYLLTTIYMWSLEEYIRGRSAEQVFFFDEAGSSYESQQLFTDLRNRYRARGEAFAFVFGDYLEEHSETERTFKYALYVLCGVVLVLCMGCWMTTMGVLIVSYCPTIPKSDYNFPACVVFSILFFPLFGLLALLVAGASVFWLLKAVCWCCCGDVHHAEAVYAPAENEIV